jgi:hypothetical protein
VTHSGASNERAALTFTSEAADRTDARGNDVRVLRMPLQRVEDGGRAARSNHGGRSAIGGHRVAKDGGNRLQCAQRNARVSAVHAQRSNERAGGVRFGKCCTA